MMVNRSSSEVLEEAIEAAKAFDPPLGVYVVDHQGGIRFCNRKFDELLGPDACGHNMSELFVDPHERFSLDEKMMAAQASDQPFLEGVTLHLQSIDHSRRVYVKDFSRLLMNDNGEWAGMQCCLFDITAEQTAQRLFEKLPVGVYLLDAEDQLAFGNDKLARFHGFENFEQIRNRRVSDFFVEEKVAEEIREEILKKGEIENRRVRLRGSAGRPFWGSITATKLTEEDGRYKGREGVVVDVTREELYRQLIEELPIGLFRVRREFDGSEVFEHYNPALAKITGYEGHEELLGQPISILHESEQSYFEFRDRVDSLSEGGDHLGPEHLRIRTKSGDETRTIEVTTRTIRDDGGNAVLRVGAGHDVTDQEELRAWEKLFREDFGSFLHTVTSNLMSLRHTLEVARIPLGQDLFQAPSSATINRDIEVLDQLANELERSIEALLAVRRHSHAEGALAPESWADLQQTQNFLQSGLRQLPPGLQHATSREMAQKVVEILQEWVPHHAPRELERAVRQKAMELARRGTLLSLHLAEARLIEMDGENQRLREVVVSAHAIPESKSLKAMGDLVRQALNDHSEYAKRQKVETRFRSQPSIDKVMVEVEDLAMRRAMGNLVHNAIKYSWHEPKGVYANLELFMQDGQMGFRIRNYGVPVAEDEKEEVFKVGFRGRYSGDRRRRGTGIGLWDTLRIAKRHGGTVTLESRPASDSRQGYTSPHLTTVEMLIALPDSEKENNR